MNAAGGLIDVWEISGIDDKDLIGAPEGFVYLPRPISTGNLRLIRTIRPLKPDAGTHRATTA
jgi:hypothetical protein